MFCTCVRRAKNGVGGSVRTLLKISLLLSVARSFAIVLLKPPIRLGRQFQSLSARNS